MLEEVLKAAKEEKVAVHCIEKVTEKSKTPHPSSDLETVMGGELPALIAEAREARS